MIASISTLFALVLVTGDVEASQSERLKTSSLVIKAAEIHIGDGQVFKPGTIVLMDGKVQAVGRDPGLPLGSKVIDCGDCIITPGLIDAACQLGTHTSVGFSEQSSEVIPHLQISDSIDLHSKSLETLAKGGVTTVYVSPESASVIGSHGAVVKTGGNGHSRLVEAPASIKATIGPESYRRASFNRSPSSFGTITFLTRRPTTRMGSTWVFRKAFYDAIRHRDMGSSDGDPEAMAALGKVLSGDTKLRFQARKAHDIHSAERLCSEFGIDHIIEYGTEAYRALDLLAANKTSVIYGPIYISPTGLSGFDDSTQACLTGPAKLKERGIPFSLTACDLVGEDGLARQAGRAIRYGLDRETALKSVTSSAARIIGIDKKVGRLTKGMDADLVVWNGTPLDDVSKPVLVLVDGATAYDAGMIHSPEVAAEEE